MFKEQSMNDIQMQELITNHLERCKETAKLRLNSIVSRYK